MSLEICVLGSGSGGNSTLVRSGGGAVLIDAGFGPRTTVQRLHAVGVHLEQIAAICLTHLDSDHFNLNWLATLVKHRIRVYCHKKRVKDLQRNMHAVAAGRKAMMPAVDLVCAFEGDNHAGSDEAQGELRREGVEEEKWREAAEFEPVKGLRCRPIHLAHDREGSHGFLLESGGRRMGYATDLGRVPAGLIDFFAGVDVLALESNYDPDMQRDSDRSWHLKQRIMGGAGHLSNAEAFAAVRAILDKTQERRGRLPRHIVLLHRSRQCNCPNLVRQVFERDARIKQVLTLADQFEPTRWLRVREFAPLVGEQMALAW